MSSREQVSHSDDPEPTNPSPDPENMRATATRTNELFSALTSVTNRIKQTTQAHSIQRPVRLVAVSKLKPMSDVLALASPPPTATNQSQTQTQHAHFGENYVQELLQKSALVPRHLRGKIHWHFIGGLQSNKAQILARDVAGLWAVESVDSVKKARLLDKGRGERRQQFHERVRGGMNGDENKAGKKAEIRQKTATEEETGTEKEQAKEERKEEVVTEEYEGPLRVFVQINTSNESTKSGLEPQSSDLLDLCRTVRDECPNLTLQGVMTIGAIARSQATIDNPNQPSDSLSNSEPENEDFRILKASRDWLVTQLGLNSDNTSPSSSSPPSMPSLELSMGMSEDFEVAIRMGSDEVRVGSTIFGARPPKGGL